MDSPLDADPNPQQPEARRPATRSPATVNETSAAGMVPEYVRKLAWFLDDAIPLVGKHRIGADGFLSFIPVVGEAAGFSLAAIVVLAGVRAGCSWPTVARMCFNAIGESVLGLIPIVGAVIAFFWKANTRNLTIIENNLADRAATTRESWKVLLFAALLGVVLLLLLAISVFLVVVTIWKWITGS